MPKILGNNLLDCPTVAKSQKAKPLSLATFALDMKRGLCILWLIATFFQPMARLGWVLYYHLNKAKIIATLCENRDKPDMHCDGKCYLRKKLEPAPTAAASSESNKIPPLPKSLQEASQSPFSMPPCHDWSLVSSILGISKRAGLPSNNLPRVSQDYRAGVFKPPVHA